ncbi:MAG: feruloyl-CoA synthase, partial [Hyphomicrobiales bacterium]
MNQHSRPAATAPHRPITFAPPSAERTVGPDGTIRLTCAAELGPYDPSLARLFRAAVEEQPARVFLVERVGEAWRKLTYEQARPKVDAL